MHDAAGLRTLLIECLTTGTASALADTDHPGAASLPTAGASRLLLLRFFRDDAERLAGDAEAFEVAYGAAGGETVTARIAWDALLSVAGQRPNGQRGFATRDDRPLPEWLGPEAQRPAQVRLVWRGLGLDPQSTPIWRYALTDAPAQPDKAAALRGLLAVPDARLFVIVDTGVEGVTLEPPLAAPGPVSASLPIATEGLRIGGLFVEGQFQSSAGPVGRVRLPWAAIGAVQDLTREVGWYWPDDLAPQIRTTLPPESAGRRGLALAPPPRLPLVVLPAPPLTHKRQALEVCRSTGGAALLVARFAEGAQVPGDFGDLPILAVPLFDVPGLPPTRPEVTGLFVRITLVDFSGTAQRLTLPWNAIFAITNNNGSERVHAFPTDYPEVVGRALRAAARLRETGSVSEGEGVTPFETPQAMEAPCIGIREEDGQVLVTLLQPIGPPRPEGGRPILHLDFLLPPEEAPPG